MSVRGIYGLSGSGIDIESMVKVGMMGKQSEYDKMAQKYTKNEWTKAAYLELNTNITTFNTTKLSDYKMSKNMNAKTATSSNDDIKVTANAGAQLMTHKVEVSNLAYNAYLIGTEAVTRKNTSEPTSIKLADALFKNGIEEDGDDYKVSYDGTNDLTFGKDEVALRFTISNGSKEETIQYTYGQLYNEGVTFNDLASKISNTSGLNIKASYDSVNDRFSFYNTTNGSESNITFTLDKVTDSGYREDNAENIAVLNAKDFLNNLHLMKSVSGTTETIGIFDTSSETNFTKEVKGENGTILIDGASYTTKDNKVTVSGVIYDVTGATQGASSTVSVSQDTDAIVDKVKSFVEEYNKLLSSLYEKYDEKPDSNYKPLTQSQKDAMKEEQITKWEEKAKKGLLYHDQTISRIILDMRSAISNPVNGIDGKYNSAYSLGIGTTGIKGQLTFDESKLRAALAEDPDSVYKVFAKIDSKDEANGNGVAQRLGDVFTSATKKIKSKAGSSSDITEDSELNKLLRQLQTKMSNFKKMMNSFEDALYKKYDKMESMLARLGTQMNYVMGSSGNQ